MFSNMGIFSVISGLRFACITWPLGILVRINTVLKRAIYASENTPLHNSIQYPPEVVGLFAERYAIDATDADNNTALILAAKGGYLASVRSLLEHGANINARGQGDATALHWAINFGHTDTAIELISRGSNLDLRDGDGNTALCLAASSGQVELTDELIAGGANIAETDSDNQNLLHIVVKAAGLETHPNIEQILSESNKNTTETDCYNDTNSCSAASWEYDIIIERLVKIGVDINHVDKDGLTALHWAVFFNDLDRVKKLIQLGADVNAHTRDNLTPLHMLLLNIRRSLDKRAPSHKLFTAINSSTDTHLAIIEEFIIAGANFNATNHHRDTVLHWACCVENTAIALKIMEAKDIALDACNQRDNTALHVAMLNGNVELASHLLAAGAKLDYKNEQGEAPLHIAVCSNYIDLVLQLLEYGADIDCHNAPYGHTALHIATIIGNTELALKLIERGANIHRSNNNNETALHMAASRGLIELTLKLIEEGAKIDTPNRNGDTPIHLAIRRGYHDLAAQLIKLSIDLELPNHVGRTILHEAVFRNSIAIVELLIESGAQINSIDHRGASPIWYAVFNGNFEIIKLLLTAGADPNINIGNTSLLHFMVPCMAPQEVVDVFYQRLGDTPPPLSRLTAKEKMDIFKVLSRGADINKISSQNNNLLHRALIFDLPSEVISYLINKGIELDHKNQDGNTPLHLAILGEKVQIIFELLAAGAKIAEQNNEGRDALTIIHQEFYNNIITPTILRIWPEINAPEYLTSLTTPEASILANNPIILQASDVVLEKHPFLKEVLKINLTKLYGNLTSLLFSTSNIISAQELCVMYKQLSSSNPRLPYLCLENPQGVHKDDEDTRTQLASLQIVLDLNNIGPPALKKIEALLLGQPIIKAQLALKLRPVSDVNKLITSFIDCSAHVDIMLRQKPIIAAIKKIHANTIEPPEEQIAR
jgi:ankyrin repeat protein